MVIAACVPLFIRCFDTAASTEVSDLNTEDLPCDKNFSRAEAYMPRKYLILSGRQPTPGRDRSPE